MTPSLAIALSSESSPNFAAGGKNVIPSALCDEMLCSYLLGVGNPSKCPGFGPVEMDQYPVEEESERGADPLQWTNRAR